MLQLRNETPFAATIAAVPDTDGIDALWAIVKGTFRLGEKVEVAEAQVPIAIAAQHHGDPGETSISVPSDLALSKPGVDVLLLGWGQDDDNMHSPNEKFSLDDFHRGIKASAYLWQELATRRKE